jgi:plasmid maintenance system antidote protein VapI
LNWIAPVVHPGRLLKRELGVRKLSANRLSLDIGVPSGRITDILNNRRAVTTDTAVRARIDGTRFARPFIVLQAARDIHKTKPAGSTKR